MVVSVTTIAGLKFLTHLAVTHASTAFLTHAAQAAAYAVTHATVAQIAAATVAAGFTAGCVVWTVDRINNLKNGVQAIAEGKTRKAVWEFGQLALSADLDVKLMPDAIVGALQKIGLATNNVRAVAQWVKDHELAIAQQVLARC